ncbi:hypothetical protein Tco_0219319 [Tanacetum coccineum]
MSNNNLQTNTSTALHNTIMEAGGKDRPSMRLRQKIDAEAESVQTILTGIDNDIYSTVDASERLKQWKCGKQLRG